MNTAVLEKMLVAMMFPLEKVMSTRSVQGSSVALGLTQGEALQGQGVLAVGCEDDASVGV